MIYKVRQDMNHAERVQLTEHTPVCVVIRDPLVSGRCSLRNHKLSTLLWERRGKICWRIAGES